MKKILIFLLTILGGFIFFPEIYSSPLQDDTSSIILLEKPLLDNSSSDFAGVEKCKKCHKKEYSSWKKTTHADALNAIDDIPNNISCLRCHVTGFGKLSGFKSLKDTPNLVNVQCEACHGPGKKHIETINSGKAALYYKCKTCSLKKSCLKCHTSQRSPNFSLQRDYKKVKHK